MNGYLSSPAIAQRLDVGSDNTYSMLPYLARAGVIDAAHRAKPPDLTHARPVLAWTTRAAYEGLPMALSMLGLRVCVFDGDEDPMNEDQLMSAFEVFDAIVDAPLAPATLAAADADERLVCIGEADAVLPAGLEQSQLSQSRLVVLSTGGSGPESWDALCDALGLVRPVDDFPVGAPRSSRLFRNQRHRRPLDGERSRQRNSLAMDDSPWVLPVASGWQPALDMETPIPVAGSPVAEFRLTEASEGFSSLVETFPGNLASFAGENHKYSDEGVQMSLEAVDGGLRPYRSAALSTVASYGYGRFEAEIRPASGSGLVTGFFLHRDAPLQEIDLEFVGSHPCRVLANIYFNPGDDGTSLGYGYRGSPCWIDLGFDASAIAHLYAIDWRPDRVTWLVDGKVVHERVSWDPTPVPHLKMRLHANLWAPRSEQLAGRVDKRKLPSAAIFRNVSIRA